MVHRKLLKLSWFFVLFCVGYFPTFGMISKSTQTLPTQKVGLYDLSQDFRNVIKTPPQEFIDLKIEIGFLNHEASGIYKLMPYYQRVLPKDSSGALPHIIQKNPLDGTWEMRKIYDFKNQEIIHSFPIEIENPLRDSIVVNVFETLKKEAQKMKKESENLKKEVKSKNENMESLKKEIEFLQTLNAENMEANRKEFENKLLEKENQIKDINGKFQKKYKNLKFEQNQTFEAKQKLIENKHVVEKKDLKKKHEEEIQIMQEKFEQEVLEKDNEISNLQIQFTKFQKLNENLETENSGFKYKQTILEENYHSCHSLYKKVENELTKLKEKTKKVAPMKNKPTEVFYDCKSDSLMNSESIIIKKFQQELHEKDNQLYNLRKEIVRWNHNNTIEYERLHTLHTKLEQNLAEESKMLRKSQHILKEEIKILKDFQAKNLNEDRFEPDSDILTNIERVVNQNHQIKLLEKEHELKLLEKDNQLKFEHNLKEKIKISNEFQYKTIATNWNENKFETTEVDSDILTNRESIIKQEYQLKLFEKETQLQILKNELIEFNKRNTFEYEMLHIEHLKLEKELQEENQTLKKTVHKLKETIKNFRIMIKNVAEDKLQNTALKLDMKKGFLNILCEKDNQIINLQKSNKDLLSDCAKWKSKEENLRNTQNISSNDEKGCENMIIQLEKMHEQENYITNLQSQLAEFHTLSINLEPENVTLKSKEEDSINAESILSNNVEKVIIEINKMHEKEIQIKDSQSQLAECQKLSNHLFSKYVKFKSKEENLTNTERISSNVVEKIYKNVIINELEKRLVEKDTKIKNLESQLTECQNLESEKIKSNFNEKNVSCSSSNVEKNMIIEELEKKLFKKETNLNNLDLAFTTLDDIHKKVETQLKTENDKLKKLKKCNLPMQKKALISKIENKEEEILELQNKIYNLQIEMTDIKKLNEDLKSENNHLMKLSSETEIELKEKNISEKFIIEDVSVKSLVEDVIAYMEYDYKNLVSYFIKQLNELDIHGNGHAELQAEIKSSLNLNELNRTSDMLNLDDKYTSVFVSHGVMLYVEEQTHSIEKLKFLETLNFDPKSDDEGEIIENWWISIGKPIYFDVLTTIDKKHKQIRDKALESFENPKLKAKYELFMKHNELFLDPKHEYENVLTDVGYIVHGVRQTMIEFKNSLYNYYSTMPGQTNKTY